MVKRTKFLRVNDKTLEILKLKKDSYRQIYGKDVHSFDDVLQLDYGIKFIPIKRGFKK